MNDVLRTILYSYPSFDGVLDGIENLVYYKALTSYECCNKTLEQAEKIVQLNDRAARLRWIKSLVENLIFKLTAEEKDLIYYKYFRMDMGKDFDTTSRRYFRRQNRVEKKLEKSAEKYCLDDKWFDEHCGDIYFLRAKYQRLKRSDGNRLAKNAAHDSNL